VADIQIRACFFAVLAHVVFNSPELGAKACTPLISFALSLQILQLRADITARRDIIEIVRSLDKRPRRGISSRDA
jgi:hypothetical protein